MVRYQARRCTSDACRLRFPVAAGSELGARCPLCGAPTDFEGDPYGTHGAQVPAGDEGAASIGLEILLDNIRSLRNVGSMFRTADGAGVQHMHLGGFTPTPEHPRMAKTSLGAERAVPWTKHPDGVAAAALLRDRGLRLWAVEGGPGSRSLFDVVAEPDELGAALTGAGVALVFGHEVSGVDPRITALCHRVVSLPMRGVKGSLNVSVAFGIAVYVARHWFAN